MWGNINVPYVVEHTKGCSLKGQGHTQRSNIKIVVMCFSQMLSLFIIII